MRYVLLLLALTACDEAPLVGPECTPDAEDVVLCVYTGCYEDADGWRCPAYPREADEPNVCAG